ncbi:MAG: hypothetical protein NT056_08170 [Proteobacteria bacterium]|nr:hypothetical protein [Pseudomonadota bacterium]
MKTKMDVKVDVKRKYKFQGKEYDSIEDMPAEGQAAFKKAMPSESDLALQMDLKTGPTKISYQGKEYDLDELPPIVRKVYEKLMEKTQKGPRAIEPSSASEIENIPEPTPKVYSGEIPAEPIAPKATSPAARVILTLVALGAIIFLIYYLRG